jgi:glycosyltransferase involved in cell wall biosynthesis
MKVLLLTRYERLGASSRVRFLQFIPALERAGFTFDVRPLLDNAYVLALYGGPSASRWRILAGYLRRLARLLAALAGSRHDVVWLEKEAFPYLPAFIETTLLRRVPYVVDLDDAWFYRYEAHPSPLVRALLRGKIDAVMRNAAIVVAGNDYLAARARAAGARRIEIIPTAIDLARYGDASAAHAEARPAVARPRPAVVGWIGIPLNAHYLTLIEPALRLVARQELITLHVVGAPLPPELAGIPAASFPWSEATEVARIGDFDIGIMPLHDTPWERGKCAYKLLQVMAAGKPVIAAPVGANCQVVRHGVNGFLAATQAEWADALRALAGDPALRSRMGEEARRTVAAQYSVATAGPRLASVLAEAASSRRR